MEQSVKLKSFLDKHNFTDINIDTLSNALLDDMTLGLQKEKSSQQLMAVMPFPVRTTELDNKVIVIDAGGTNFRSCLVEKLEDGSIKISEERKSSMIALDREYSREEFFTTLEEKINYLKDKADEIHFCFSYAMKNLPDGDAQVITFSKQVKAKAVNGSYIGKELQSVLKKKGWTSVKKIKVVNDTLACLLAGMSDGSRNYDSYAGFILGTGINNAYIEKGPVGKLQDDLQEHIVVCECGMYNSVPLSDFDISLDKASTNPGCSLLEKMCSGVYLGKIAGLAITAACNEKLFTENFAEAFSAIDKAKISAYEISLFMEETDHPDNILQTVCEQAAPEDKSFLIELLNAIILRSIKISASVITATAVKAGGKNICITCNGSTFWKTKDFKTKVEQYLQEQLLRKHNICYTILNVENDITIGTALA